MKRCVFASMGGDLLFLLSALLPLLSLLLSSLMPRGNFLETAIHGCKSHLVSNSMVTMTSERIIEQVNERVGVRKRPPLRE